MQDSSMTINVNIESILLTSYTSRWIIAAENLQNIYDNLIGDVLISSGVIAYLGAFTSSYRGSCTTDWTSQCKVSFLKGVHNGRTMLSYIQEHIVCS